MDIVILGVTAETFEFTAELIRKGVVVSDIYRKVQQTMTRGNFLLLKKAMDRLEILEDGKYGIIVPNTDQAIIEILEDMLKIAINDSLKSNG